MAVGGSLILLQIANHKGYIKINWAKVNKDLEGASKKLAQTRSDQSIPKMLDKVYRCIFFSVVIINLHLVELHVHTYPCSFKLYIYRLAVFS